MLVVHQVPAASVYGHWIHDCLQRRFVLEFGPASIGSGREAAKHPMASLHGLDHLLALRFPDEIDISGQDSDALRYLARYAAPVDSTALLEAASLRFIDFDVELEDYRSVWPWPRPDDWVPPTLETIT